MIIIYVLFGLLFLYLFGFYFNNQFNINRIQPLSNIIIGYVVSQFIFLIGIYVTNAYVSFYFLMAIFLILSLIHVPAIIKQFSQVKIIHILGLVGLVAVISNIYIYYGLEDYWHTASEDAFDAINGKDYILEKINSLENFVLNTERLNEFKQQGGEISGKFLYTDIVLQYTSVTFWSLFFDLNSSFDPFLIQAIINLIAMYFGVTLLSKEVFHFSTKLSLTIAFISVFSNLYYTTYLNSHEGSMIFGAVMPYVLYLFFNYTNKNNSNKKTILLLLILMSAFLLFSYKHPYIFFLAPAIAYAFKDKIKLITPKIISQKKYLLITLFISAIFFSYIYNVFEYYSNFRDIRFRSWGISLAPEMLLVYWGLAQSQVTNIGISTDFIFHNELLKNILYFLSITYTCITLYGSILLSKKHEYFKYFNFFWILFFVFFKFILSDSYFFYKFLYTTQFIFAIYFVYGINLISQKKYLKMVSVLALGSFLISNTYYNIESIKNIYNENYNRNSHFLKQMTLNMPPEMVRKSFLEIPKQHFKQIIQTNLRTNGIFTKMDIKDASYIVLMKGIEDIYFNTYNEGDIVTKYENDMFRIIEKPKHYLSLYGGWESEILNSTIGNFSNIPFRWISHDYGKGKFIVSAKDDKKYLQLCFESGPSIEFQEFDIHFENENHTAQGVDCKYFTLSNKAEYEIYSTVRGKKLLPFDQRYLEYKIANLKTTNYKYSNDVLKILNPKNDVANQDFSKPNNIFIGNGWYPQEQKNMRWGSNNLELLIKNSTKDSIKAELDIEPGPSVEKLPLQIKVLNKDNKAIGYIEIQGRQKITLDLPVVKNESYQILKLEVLNKSKKLDSDPRNLNLRLFSISTVE